MAQVKRASTPPPCLKRALRLGVVGFVVVIALFFVDQHLALHSAALAWEIADAARILTEFGEGQWVVVPAILLFVYGWRAGFDNLARWAFLLTVTVAVSGGLANALKILFGRWRPVAFIEGEEFGFRLFTSGSVNASFPSGHATTAAAAALVIALWFPKLRWYALATGVLIAATRVVLSMHYPSDIAAGWLLGAATVVATLWIWWRVHPASVPHPVELSWPRSPIAIVWTAILLGTLVRVLIGLWLPLGIDEAYEVATCQSVVWSGFDHPPLVYWMTRLGLWLNGSGAVDPIWIRAPFILCFALSSWLLWRLTALCFSAEAGAWSVVLLNLSALFSVALGGWALPDGPLLAAALLMAIALVHGGVAGAVPHTTPHPRAVRNPYHTWILAGGALGIAALAKYQAILIALGVLVALLTSAHGRRMLRHPAPWIGALVALSFAAPVVLWNATNEWASFRFQGGRAASMGGIHPLRAIELLGAQAGILLPWIWAPLIFEWFKWLFKGRRSPMTWFFVCLAGVPVLTFLLISLWGTKGLPHWSAIGYLFAFPLLGVATAHELARGNRKLVRNWLVFSVAILAIIVPIGVSQASNGWITRAIPALIGAKDPTLEALPWTSVRRYIEARVAQRTAQQKLFAPPPPPTVKLTVGPPTDVPCDDEDALVSEPPADVAVAPPAQPAAPLAPLVEVFAPPPPKRVTRWVRTPAKVSRPARTVKLDQPTPEFDLDVLARCGDEGITRSSFFLAGVSWRDTGKLAVAVEGLGIPVVCLHRDARQFAWGIPQRDLEERDALIIVRSQDAAQVERDYAQYFDSITPIAVIRINRGTSIADQVTVLCALRFQGESLWRYGR